MEKSQVTPNSGRINYRVGVAEAKIEKVKPLQWVAYHIAYSNPIIYQPKIYKLFQGQLQESILQEIGCLLKKLPHFKIFCMSRIFPPILNH